MKVNIKLFIATLVVASIFTGFGLNIQADTTTIAKEETQYETAFEKFGGEYDLAYILNHYNIVSFAGDTTLGNHILGAVLVNGNFSGTGSGFADAKYVWDKAINVIAGENTFAGRAYDRAQPEDVSTIDLNPVVLGYANLKDDCTTGDCTNGKSNVLLDEDFVSFEKLKDAITKQMNEMTKDAEAGVFENDTFKVQAGTTVKYKGIKDQLKPWSNLEVHITGDIFEGSKSTIIVIEDSGEIEIKSMWIKGKQPSTEEGDKGEQPNTKEGDNGDKKVNLIYYFPNASKVTVGEGGQWAGHIIVPNGTLYNKAGNYAGANISNATSTTGEGHLYGYEEETPAVTTPQVSTYALARRPLATACIVDDPMSDKVEAGNKPDNTTDNTPDNTTDNTTPDNSDNQGDNNSNGGGDSVEDTNTETSPDDATHKEPSSTTQTDMPLNASPTEGYGNATGTKEEIELNKVDKQEDLNDKQTNVLATGLATGLTKPSVLIPVIICVIGLVSSIVLRKKFLEN